MGNKRLRAGTFWGFARVPSRVCTKSVVSDTSKSEPAQSA